MSAPALIGLTGPCADQVAAVLDGHGYRVHDAAEPARRALAVIDPLLPSGRSLTALVGTCGWDGATRDRTDGPEVARLVHAMRTEVPAIVLGGAAWLTRVTAEISAAADLLGGAPVALLGVDLPAERAWVREHGGTVWNVGPQRDPDSEANLPADVSAQALGRRVERELARAAHPLVVA
ncbi:hypothetical protein [Cellulosimicrobium sp. Marseille-Q4280]|uniref:hypothetical protein n=1 Tax=Cellulosimicrobium sp. Marseille-Q4280 TaxID=2937992 RepID=UPI0020416D45|nr:hypothetical protein [Cellulosimicrobium sp. Marseille-Q4280]